ncbi:MAG: YbdK family carboxylate-amine ligase [Solirubrobacteraceae bacterium]
MTTPSSAAALREAFAEPSPPTVGVEEEVMLLDPGTLDLAPRAAELLGRLAGDPRFKLELPASQLEIVLPPAARAGEIARGLAAARLQLADTLGDVVRLGVAGAHPFAAVDGEVNRGERYDRLVADYGTLARRQLVCALQVHVAIRGPDRALAVYNALRCHLPDIAAIAANAPFHAGRDTGLASVRPLIAQLLPRQGVPPALASWEALADQLRWGARAAAVPEPRRWWWELRPNPSFGTLEVRVPDAQSTVSEAAGVTAVVQCLAVDLAERHDAGEPLPAAPTWRIAENRSAALRGGLDARLMDLTTGRPQPARERLDALLGKLSSTAERLGCVPQLAEARRLLERGAPARQREVAAKEGVRGVAAWLAERFLDGVGR